MKNLFSHRLFREKLAQVEVKTYLARGGWGLAKFFHTFQISCLIWLKNNSV